MAIFVDNVTTHGDSNQGNDFVPPGISGLDWGHIISDTSLLDLDTFLTTNLLTVGQPATNVRTPALGSNMTYAGITDAMRTAALAAGATAQGRVWVLSHSFDAGPGTWEP